MLSKEAGLRSTYHIISFIQHPGKGRHDWKENRLMVSRDGGRRVDWL